MVWLYCLQDRDSMPNWYTINHPTTLHTHNETQWPTAARRWHFALRDVSRRQSCHLLTSCNLDGIIWSPLGLTDLSKSRGAAAAPPAPAAFCLENWTLLKIDSGNLFMNPKVANMHYNIFDIFWSILESKLHLASELMLKSRFIRHILTNFVNFKDEGWTDKSQRQNILFK